MKARRTQTRKAHEAFMMGVGRVKAATDPRDIHTLPLFPLALILEADGALGKGVEDLARRYQA